MGIGDIMLIAGSIAFGVLVLNPRIMQSRKWHATVTPLASIIGSGFLIAGPVLSHTVGHWAWAAMMSLCAIGYFYGAAIRHNIRFVEPQIEAKPPRIMLVIEEISDLALALAFFVSVAYYLNLFAAFALRSGEIVDPFWIKSLATAVIGGLGLLGLIRGLDALEGIEVPTVGVKLALIGGLCTAMLVLAFLSAANGTLVWPVVAPASGIIEWQVLLGLVLMVQGFETSRYLGDEYDTELRIASMRRAQLLATAIYLVSMLLVTFYFDNGLAAEGGETAIIDLLRPVGVLIAPLIIAAALTSQLSAAVAELSGAGGLISESSRGRIPVRLGYMVTAGAAIVITWAGNIYEIITFASKAFVIYYGLQSLQAALSNARLTGVRHKAAAILFGAGVVLALVIVIFAIPAQV